MSLQAPLTQNLTSKFQKGKHRENDGSKGELLADSSTQKMSNQGE